MKYSPGCMILHKPSGKIVGSYEGCFACPNCAGDPKPEDVLVLIKPLLGTIETDPVRGEPDYITYPFIEVEPYEGL